MERKMVNQGNWDKQVTVIERVKIMEFMRSDQMAEVLTADDRMELFMCMPTSSSDLTIALFNELLESYDSPLRVQEALDQSEMEEKAKGMAVLNWFHSTGEFSPTELYDWVQNVPDGTVNFTDDVEPCEANEHTWACNAADELSISKHLLMEAMGWAVSNSQPKDDPDTISLKWSVDDVLGQMEGRDETLSRGQAREILANIGHARDACTGVNWDVISCHIDMYLNDLREKES